MFLKLVSRKSNIFFISAERMQKGVLFMSSSLLRASLFLVLILPLVSCNYAEKSNSSEENDIVLSTNMSITQQDVVLAKRTFAKLVGATVRINDISYGPSGTIRINTQDEREFYLLPDRVSLIEGSLFQSDLLSQTAGTSINPPDKTLRRGLESSSTEYKESIRSALVGKNDSQNLEALIVSAGKKKLSSDAKVRRDYSERMSNQTKNQRPLEVASLPRNNTVFDKSEFLSDTEKLDWISEGESKRILYVYYDYNCPACQKAHQALEPFIASNLVTVRWVPVGTQSEDSTHRAILSLVPTDNISRLKLMKKLATRKPLKELISIAPPQEEARKAAYKAQANLKQFVRHPHPGTPMFAFQSHDGAQVRFATSKKIIGEIIESIDPQ